MKIVAFAICADSARIDAPLSGVRAAAIIAEAAGVSLETYALCARPEKIGEHPDLQQSRRLTVCIHDGLNPDAGALDFAMVAAECLQADLGDQPALVFAPTGPFGLEFAGALSVLMKRPCIGPCDAVELTDGGVRATRAAYGARVATDLAFPDGGVVILRPPRAAARSAQPPAEIVTRRSDIALSPPLRFERTPLAERAAGLEGARIVVSGGRGMDETGFALLAEIAERLGGALGASLPAIDAGLAPTSRQVGQSGKFVTPELYLAVGLSGTPQHLAGISAATRVLAINKDPAAPIFDYAELGVVADWREILPTLRDHLLNAAESNAQK